MVVEGKGTSLGHFLHLLLLSFAVAVIKNFLASRLHESTSDIPFSHTVSALSSSQESDRGLVNIVIA